MYQTSSTLISFQVFIFLFQNFTAFDSIFRFSLAISSYYWNPNNMNLTFRNNSLSSSEGSDRTLSVYNPYVSGASIRLQQNSFTGKMISLSLNVPTIFDISDNIFDNSMSGQPANIQLQGPYGTSLPSTNNRAVQIRDNIFSKINGDRAAILTVGCISGGYEYIASITVEGNTFVNNSVTTVLTSNCRGLYLSRNRFLTEQQTIVYRTSVPLSSGAVLYATGNFWNATSYGDVAAKIFDQQDDPILSPIEVSPWFDDVNMTVLDKTESTFFRNGGLEIGGTLPGDITLQKMNQSFTVVEDIYVPYGFTLRIEEGVQLNFKQGGITVEGIGAKFTSVKFCLILFIFVAFIRFNGIQGSRGTFHISRLV